MNTRWGNSGKKFKEEEGSLKKIKMILNLRIFESHTKSEREYKFSLKSQSREKTLQALNFWI